MSAHPNRLAWVDLMRGTALVGMVAYHAAWDLHAFGFASVDPGADPGWRLLGHGVAAVFLALSGFSLSLAMEGGRSGAAMLWRLVRIAAAAGLVSVASWLVLPEAPIWFGILHCLVITNAIAITIRRLSIGPLLALAAIAWLAPPRCFPRRLALFGPGPDCPRPSRPHWISGRSYLGSRRYWLAWASARHGSATDQGW